MQTIDLRKTLKALYAAGAEPAVIDVPALPCLMIDGAGDPNTAPAFQEAMQALYSIAYTLKFHLKKTQEIDFTVMSPEGLWWVPDMAEFDINAKDRWLWTMLIVMPDIITPELVAWAADEIARKKRLATVCQVRLETLQEGRSVQILHIGPFSEEGPAVAKLHAFIANRGSVPNGKHHEMYLSDARRVPAEKWRTIIRQPFTM